MSDFLFTTYENHELQLPFLIYGLGMNHIQEPIGRPTGIPLYQWIQCISGRGTLYINQHEFIIEPGQGMFLHPGVGHSYQSIDQDEEWIVNFICFKGSGMPSLLDETQLDTSGVFTLNEADLITGKLEAICKAKSSPLPPAFTMAFHSSALYDILLHLLLHTSVENGQNLSVQNHRIAPVITYIEEHYTEPIFLDNIAALCGLSEEYLCQLFKKATGMRLFEYIQRTRIKHSKELLLGMSDLPSHIIGEFCGFHSSSYFNKIFKKYEGTSPGDFRRQNGIYRRK